jgi:hypothetical protein
MICKFRDQGPSIAIKLLTIVMIIMIIMINPRGVHGETRITPSLYISERYDSNVFFVPGKDLQDYVTSVSPQARVNHKGNFFEGVIGGGATAEVYARNPGLNYVAGNGLIDLNLDQAIGKIAPGLGLRFADTFYFTPQPPAFVAPVGVSQAPEAFVRGIQAQRANSLSNIGKVIGSYAILPVLSFTSTYTDQRIRFQNPIFAPTGQLQTSSLIDTTFQTVTTGPVLKISPLDTVTVSHQYQQGRFNSVGPESGFKTQGALLGWIREISPNVKADLAGGFAIFEGSKNVQFVGSASIEWKLPNTQIMLSYSRKITPSFIFVGVPLLSQVVDVVVTYHVTEPLSVFINGNYALNESLPDSSVLAFKSYSMRIGMDYKFTQDVSARLSYTRSEFESTVFAESFLFDRNTVMLTMVLEWN